MGGDGRDWDWKTTQNLGGGERTPIQNSGEWGVVKPYIYTYTGIHTFIHTYTHCLPTQKIDMKMLFCKQKTTETP